MGIMAKKEDANDANKSQAIRDFLNANPKAKPRQVVAALKEQGHEVTAAYVSTIKSLDKKKQGKVRRRGRPAGSTNAASAAAAASASSAAGEKLSLQTLLAAKKLAEQLGGIAQAKAAIDALSKLGL
jgi:arginine repressor